MSSHNMDMRENTGDELDHGDLVMSEHIPLSYTLVPDLFVLSCPVGRTAQTDLGPGQLSWTCDLNPPQRPSLDQEFCYQ